ncbi:MAG: helix-turn-helix domain-containing protein [Acidimicrobiaceae bacterium]|nr:helix-turn-helix domain-containing protein [Acidimicrobiaceae bacterium]
MDFPEIMDSDQAACFLRRSRTHVQGLARDGIIPANRAPNGRWVFSRAALVSWAAGEKVGVY